MTLYTTLGTPIGELLLTSDGAALTGLYMPDHAHGPEVGAGWVSDDGAALFAATAEQLREYFGGGRRLFDLPLAPAGTLFQLRVWAELRRIPYGATVTYGDLARRLGDPGASRAVGLANGRNPISIIVPCHRVVGAGGKLTGYAGGLERKRFLLELEGGCLPGLTLTI
ncbi:MAG: methylated-DNA--[protein]-cysteine S-methyltransferase [Armatimonadetes bacterium]|nr:methylated-DNA--[protein]-cysteine S-methyltransferase [Armatimonadota bacterium]